LQQLTPEQYGVERTVTVADNMSEPCHIFATIVCYCSPYGRNVLLLGALKL